jgi:putative membrane protein
MSEITKRGFSIAEFIKNIVCGVIIGIANVIPGVSGGTMAVVLNMYDALIGAIADLRKNFARSLLLLLPVVIGAGIGILAFARVVDVLLLECKTQLVFLFVGLIVGSLPMVWKRAADGGMRSSLFIPFIVMFAFMLILTFCVNTDGTTQSIQETLTLPLFFILAGAMVIASVSMVLPGLSGSMMMMLMGQYETVIHALKTLNIPLLIPCAIGGLVGILGGAKVIKWLLKKYRQGTFAAVLGLIIGSLVNLIVKQTNFVFAQNGVESLICLICGVAVTICVERLSRAKAQ